MSETQLLMTVSGFLGFFLRIISWKGALLFNRGGFIFKWGRRCPMEGGINFDGVFFLKNHEMWGSPPHTHTHTMGDPESSGGSKEL